MLKSVFKKIIFFFLVLSFIGFRVETLEAFCIGYSTENNSPFLENNIDKTEREELKNDKRISFSESISSNEFITTWTTTSPNESITIPVNPGETYNYDVDWGDTNTSSNQTTDATHSYSSAGTYTVKITGLFPQIYFFFSSSSNAAKIQTIEQWGNNQWSSMTGAFFGCSNLDITNASIDAPDLSNVNSLAYMFEDCSSLTGGNFNSWDVSTIQTLQSMFSGASNFNQPLNSWVTNNVIDMSTVFAGATSFDQPLNSWNTSSVTNMPAMFVQATSFNQPLNNWVLSSVTNLGQLFDGAASFNQDLSGWDVTNIDDMYNMLNNSGLDAANYDATLSGWAAQSVKSNVDLGATGLAYCSSVCDRYTLTSTYSWNISGDTFNCPGINPGFWTGCAGDGQWTTASNWDNNTLPGSSDDVVINNGDAVTISSGSVTVKTISMSNSGSGLTVNAGVTLTINPPSTGVGIDMQGGVGLTNNGNVIISGGASGIESFADITNNQGGIITITACSLASIFSAQGVFTNSGTINMDGADQSFIAFGTSPTNTATGLMNVTNSGSIAFSAFSGFNNVGNITITGGTGIGLYFTNNDVFTNSGTITITGTTGNAIENFEAPALNNTGTIEGEGTFNMDNNSLGGTITPGPSTKIMTFANDQTFTATTTMEIEVNGTTAGTQHDQITIGGTATIDGTLNASINYTPTGGDRIVIISATAISGTFSTISPALPYDWKIEYSATKVELVYDYTIGKWDGEAGDGLWTTANNWEGRTLPSSSDDVIIDNGDLVTVSSGTFSVNTITMSNNSDLTISSGTTLNVNNSGSGRTIDIDGNGCDVINSGTVNITGGLYGVYANDSDWTNQAGSTMNISSFTNDGYFKNSSSGTLRNTGSMTISGGARGIYILRSSTLTNFAAGTITVQNTSNGGISVFSSGEISNFGTINVDNCGGTSISSSAIYNYASGNITVTNAGSSAVFPIISIDNAGTITITGGTGIGLDLDETDFTNTGTITVSGTAGDAFHYNQYGSNTLNNTGTLKGTGTFDTEDNDLDGTIIPGTSPGIMAFATNQTFSGSSTIEVEINGTTAGTEHDQITVNGTASISGTLDATIGYTPSKGDRIVLISATAISGTFSSISPALPYDWEIEYTATEVALVYDYIQGKWDGEVGDGLWSSADNWEGGILPTSSDDVIIDNGDLVTVSSGTVTVNTISISNNSDLTINSGTTLNVNNSGSGRTIDIDGSGCDVINSGAVNITGGLYGVYANDSDWTNQAGSTMNISSFTNDGYFKNSSSGTLRNTGSMTISGGARGIYILRSSTLTNFAAGTITVQNTSNGGISVFSSGEISNFGTINIDNCGGTSISSSAIYNYASGNITVTNAGSSAVFPVISIDNAGTITITGGTGIGLDLDETDFTNTGTITVSGTAGDAFHYNQYGSNTLNNTGTLKGTGTFDTEDNDLDGTIIPGTSPGIMAFATNQTFSGSSTIEVEINGTTAGTEHDQITVNGKASISGTLAPTINYNYMAGDRIVIISATSVSGTFSSINPSLPTGWTIDYSVTGEVALVSSVNLPVELIDFKASVTNENKVHLEWATASEIDNEGFELEHSIDGRTWEYIDFIQGAGNSLETIRYATIHNSPVSGINYYRLKQIDFDENYEYSKVVSIDFHPEQNEVGDFYPNPVGQGAARIRYLSLKEGEVFISVFDLTGKMVLRDAMQVTEGSNTLTLDFAGLKPGTYVVKLENERETAFRKIIKNQSN